MISLPSSLDAPDLEEDFILLVGSVLPMIYTYVIVNVVFSFQVQVRATQTTCMFSNTLMWMSITTSLNTTTNCLESSTLDHVLWAQALHIVVVGTRYVPRCVERWAPMPSLCLKCGWREVHGQDANSRQWTWLMHRTLPGYKSYSLKVVSEELLAPCFGTIGTLFPD